MSTKSDPIKKPLIDLHICIARTQTFYSSGKWLSCSTPVQIYFAGGLKI